MPPNTGSRGDSPLRVVASHPTTSSEQDNLILRGLGLDAKVSEKGVGIEVVIAEVLNGEESGLCAALEFFLEGEEVMLFFGGGVLLGEGEKAFGGIPRAVEGLVCDGFDGFGVIEDCANEGCKGK